MDHSSTSTLPTLRRRFPGISSSGLLIGLLTIEAGLFICDHFGWCGLNNRKGWGVLIAAGTASILLATYALWFMVCLLFGRRRQFGLGWLLLLIVAVAIPVSWLTSAVRRAYRQKAAIAMLESADAQIQFMRESKWSASAVYFQPPEVLEHIFSRPFFEDVAVLWWGSPVTPAFTDLELSCLDEFPELRSLTIHFNDHVLTSEAFDGQLGPGGRPPITSNGLSNLAELAMLEELTLSNCWQLTDAGLANIAELNRLTTLELSYLPQVTDAGLVHLQGLRQIEQLRLYGLSRVTDPQAAGIRDYRSLRSLYIALPNSRLLNDTFMVAISKQTGLEGLVLEDTGITDAGMLHVGAFTRLRTLGLVNAQLTDSAMKQICKLERLESLALNGTEITDDGVAQLVSLTQLEVLALNNTDVTDACIKHFTNLPKLVRLSIGGTRVTDGGSRELEAQGWTRESSFDGLNFSRSEFDSDN